VHQLGRDVYARRAIDLYTAVGNTLGACRAWAEATISAIVAGRWDEARVALDQAQRLVDPSWPPWQQALIDNLAGVFHLNVHELEPARRHTLAYLATSRRLASGTDVCAALGILIEIHLVAGEVKEAARLADDLATQYPELWRDLEEGKNLRKVGCAYLLAGRADESARMYRGAFARLRRNYGTALVMLYDLALFAGLRGAPDDALRLLALADAAHARCEAPPRLLARRLRERVVALVPAGGDAARLRGDERSLNEDAALALGLGTL
jgi:tetratricopeptide (TPR) repeat protein